MNGISCVFTLQYRVCGESRRNEDECCVRACFGDGLVHRVEYGLAEVRGTTFARGHSGDNLCAVLDHLFGMEGAFPACHPRHHNLRALVYKDRQSVSQNT